MTGFYPDFTIHPGDTGAAILERLLLLVPDLIFMEGVTVCLVNPQSADASVYSYGTEHVILQGRYRAGAVDVANVRIEGSDGVTADSFDWEQIDRFPERFTHIADLNIATLSQAQSRGAAVLRKAQIAAVSGVMRVPVNCGQQICDVVEVTDSLAGLTAAKRRIAGTEISYRRRRSEYVQTLYLGGV